MAGGRRNTGHHGGRNISGTRVWLEVGKTEDCMMDAMCKEPGMWLEVGETEDCMMDAMYQESGCGWM